MVYAFIQDVPLDHARYQRVMEELGPEPLAGQILHLCTRRADGGLRYIDVWESKEACTRAFDERIHTAVDTAFGGTRPGVEPHVQLLDVLDITGVAVS
ncbi:hypothetical protein [Cryobacterium sp. PH29-G1]|uniref:hypothetical protein n=1 Tax=Cryobacterium sp. PH29-G1 TaxID=3046211 RepID=UPI0024B945BC|nr:hypothetical protein [Cryobacterium sp. PH29-G1]MDJ0350536.1 hypothetical protein [Cryobacterium sp. PH29-G1]